MTELQTGMKTFIERGIKQVIDDALGIALIAEKEGLSFDEAQDVYDSLDLYAIAETFVPSSAHLSKPEKLSQPWSSLHELEDLWTSVEPQQDDEPRPSSIEWKKYERKYP
jgi:hypothetical protein